MKIRYYGQSGFGIQLNGKDVLFDPFISGNDLAKGKVEVDSVPADYLLLTHGHSDHVLDAEAIAKRTGAKIISNFEVTSHYEDKGIEVHPMNHGGKAKFDFATVKYVNAVHSSSLPDGSYAGNPGGFVVWNDDVCFYHAGDTALTMDMKLIPMTCPKLDFAILPIGDNFTMGYEDAAIAADFIQCKKIIACHFDTFGFIEIDHEAAKETFDKKGLELILPEVGETIEI